MPRRWWASVKRSERKGETHSLADFIPLERRRILDGASETKLAQMRAAEATHDVYHAWNQVCAGTREGEHVTGLHYVPESNELIVYADGSTWVGELTMMREIIRARMYRLGVDIAGIKVKLSREGYARPKAGGPRAHAQSPSPAPHRSVARHPLTAEEDARLDDRVSGIADERLRDALKRAIKASFECEDSR